MSNKNSDLISVQRQLVGVAETLSRAQERADDANTVRAIGREIVEVNHRITMIGQVIFKSRTRKITAAARAVISARRSVDAAIKATDKLKNFVTAITRFLALVDKVIDTAKLAA